MRRFVLLLAMLSAAPLAAQDGSYIRYYPPGGVSELSGSGTSITSSVPILLPDGSVGAPSLSFASDTNSGIYLIAADQLAFTVGGVRRANLSNLYFDVMTSALRIGSASEVSLFGDAANTLALRNGTNAQTFNIYNTYTDASNYERAFIRWNANVLQIGTEAAGTGTVRPMSLVPGDTTVISTTVRPSATDTFTLGLDTRQYTHVYVSRSLQGSKSKTLTDAAAAVSIWSCAVPTSDSIGGELIWSTESTDATDYRVTQGSVRFAGVNKAGTTTCTIGVIGTDLTASSNGNTLACTWTNVASTTNCLLSATCTDNTAGSQTMAVNSRLNMPIPQTCTPQ